MMVDRRLPYYIPAVDPLSDRYNESDSDGEHGPEREVDFTSRGNALSSLSVLSWMEAMERTHPDYGMLDDEHRNVLHLPVFDVDVEPSEEVLAAMASAFAGGEIHLIASTNHHHCYVDGLYLEYGDYMDRLQALATAGIVETGYVIASSQRYATFVRKPGVRKREVTA